LIEINGVRPNQFVEGVVQLLVLVHAVVRAIGRQVIVLEDMAELLRIVTIGQAKDIEEALS
jgi:hypothetical protein